MRIVFLRHGNTFAPGQTPVMVGAHEDLPLVASGIAQAEAMRDAMPRIDAMFAGPLKRTMEYARIIRQDVSVDERLRELDYGRWSGLSDEQIRARGDGAMLDAWRHEDKWPSVFVESEASVTARLSAFCLELAFRHDGTVAAVTSQGILKQIGLLAANRPAQLKVATGHACVVVVESALSIEQWNVPPSAFLA